MTGFNYSRKRFWIRTIVPGIDGKNPQETAEKSNWNDVVNTPYCPDIKPNIIEF